MTWPLPQHAMYLGTDGAWVPACAHPSQLVIGTRLVVLRWKSGDDNSMPQAIRQRLPGVRVVAWLGTAQAAFVETVLQQGFDDVALDEGHLQHVLHTWESNLDRQHDTATMLRLLDEMADKPGLQEVLRIATLGLSELFFVEQASVLMRKAGDDVAFVVTENESSGLENLVIRLDDIPEFRDVIGQRQPTPVLRKLSDSILKGRPDTPSGDVLLEHPSAVLFPLLRREEVVGALYLRGTKTLAETKGRLMGTGRMIAAVTSVALGNALEQDMLLSTQRELLRKQEDARQELLNLRQFSDVFEQSFDGIIITDPVGQIRYANPAAGAMLQTKPDYLRGGNFFELLSKRSLMLARRAYQGDPVGDAYGYVDLLVPDEVGAETVLSAAIRPLAEEGGVLVSFRDVTELREIESELRQTKEFLENLIQSSVDAIIAADIDGRIILFNRAAEQISGYGAREVVGRLNLSMLFPTGESEDVLRRLRSDAYGGRGRLELMRKDLVAKSKEMVPVNLTAAIIYEGEREVATVGIFTDLRERLKMEEKLSQVQQRLRLTERQAVAVELAGAAAHELNQPLTSILGYAEILKRRLPEEDANRKAADTICRETERMAAIVKKIGQITAYETRPYVGGSQILAFEQLVDGVVPGEHDEDK